MQISSDQVESTRRMLLVYRLYLVWGVFCALLSLALLLEKEKATYQQSVYLGFGSIGFATAGLIAVLLHDCLRGEQGARQYLQQEAAAQISLTTIAIESSILQHRPG